MKRWFLLTTMAVSLSAGPALAADRLRGPDDPYNYAARQRLVANARKADDYGTALYQPSLQ